MHAPLPIDPLLPELCQTLKAAGRAVLQAPPGAGKTTRVPLAIMNAGITTGKILMLEPRRLAARAAAERLAETLGERVGQRVGYAMRGDTKTGTHIDVVTEGILTRRLQSDPELTSIGAVIFDEFHERSLNADLGLALCLEVKAALREDLQVLVMSATLDAAPVAALMEDAPILTSEGRSFPVTTHFLPRPLPPKTRVEAAMADLICDALGAHSGGLLAFLPGEREIRRTQALLAARVPAGTLIRPLYGAMPFKDQRAAIRPEADGARKIVLATSIAETSLTIEDIRIVVDSGLARRARFDPGTGMARLVTERASRAEATQRAGRAGRVAEGDAYVLWAKGEVGTLPAFAPPEIETADLSSLVLELAAWGAAPADLPFLTQPNPASFAEAQALLRLLAALDAGGGITDHGKALAKLPLHPRLAHMLSVAGPQSAPLAALLSARDPLGRAAGADLALRLRALADRTLAKDSAARIQQETKRLAKLAPAPVAEPLSTGAMAALAYPDRVGQRRKGDAPRFVLSGGKGAVLEEGDALSGAPFIVVTDSDGNPREARIRQAVQITSSELRALFEDTIVWERSCSWSRREGRVIAAEQEKLGALVLHRRVWTEAPSEAVAGAMLEGARLLGLTFSPAAARFRTRCEMVRASGAALPEMTDEALLEDAGTWLLPHLTGIKTAAQFRALDLLEPLRSRLTWDQMQMLDRAAPAHHVTPLGRKAAIDYALDVPQIDVRLQEMFGTRVHPMIAGQPLRIVLLSPAGRPVQTTTDLPRFWQTTYADVRKDMRGRYPKHPWPEDPRDAAPTIRAKPRK